MSQVRQNDGMDGQCGDGYCQGLFDIFSSLMFIFGIHQVCASKVYTSAEFKREKDNFQSLCKNLERTETKRSLVGFNAQNEDPKTGCPASFHSPMGVFMPFMSQTVERHTDDPQDIDDVSPGG